MIETRLTLLDDILEDWREVVGDDFDGYRNHCRRMVNCCLALRDCNDVERQKLMIAAAFHDIGIWPDDEVDYLAPSIAIARRELAGTPREAWTEEIVEMIDLHHKVRPVRHGVSPLVDVFRKGDWIDVTFGLRSFGLDRGTIREVTDAFPNLGFHANLVRLGKQRMRTHPTSPLPMMRW